MKKLLLPLFALLQLALAAQTGTAQTFQWGQRGGGNTNGLNASPEETVVDMATDRNGNVYVLALIESSGNTTIGTTGITGWADRDILLASFSCSGALRWWKAIGGPNTDQPVGIGVDTLGHVYVAGRTLPGQTAVHFGTDSTLSASSVKTLFLAQYDTAGHFRWLRQPNPDTASLASNQTYTQCYDIAVEPNGDVYWHCSLRPGLIAGSGGWVNTQFKNYLLQYNAAGTMTNHIDLQLNTTVTGFRSIRLTRLRGGKFVIGGTQGMGTMTIGGQPSTHTFFIAAFNGQGQVVWQKTNATSAYSNTGLMGRIRQGASGRLYFAGTGATGDSIASVGFANPANQQGNAIPFAASMDTLGNLLWLSNGVTDDFAGAFACDLKQESELLITGMAPTLSWGGFHLRNPANTGIDVFVARLNAQTGALLALDSLESPAGYDETPSSLCTTPSGQAYLGGRFAGQLTVGPSALANTGGNTDWFVAKYGYSCSCTAPTAAFSASVNSGAKTITFTYTGTVSGLDSLRWNFGNGQGQTLTTGFGQALTRTYAAAGTYTACATAYSSCGSNQVCQQLQILGGNGLGIASLAAVSVHPNPAGDYVLVDGLAAGAQLRLLNTVGGLVRSAVAGGGATRIGLDGLSAGLYLLKVESAEGEQRVFRLVKH